MPRRSPASELPLPSLCAIIIDGSNVAASATAGAMRRIDLALAWCRSCRPDLPIMVFLDHATPGRWPPDVQRELQRRLAAPSPRWRVGGRGADVDVELLAGAVEHAALVVSNDRWWEHETRRCGVVSVQFVCARGCFAVDPMATWFTPAGGARRLSLAELGFAAGGPRT